MASARGPAAQTHSPGRGRRPGPAVGRQLILDAAHRQFGECGYQSTSVRGIARSAGVDPKLVYYYFGTKAELFSAVISATFRARGFPEILAEQPSSGGESPGIRYVAAVLTSLEREEIGPAFIGLLRNLGTHEESRRIFLRFVTEELIGALAPRLAGQRAELRVALAGSQLLGAVFARYVLRVPPLVDLSVWELALAIGPTIDSYLSGSAGLEDPGESTAGSASQAV